MNSDEGVDLLVNACRYCGGNAELYQSARFTCEFAAEAAGYREEFVKNGFARKDIIISRRPNFNVRPTYDRVLLKQATTYSKGSALHRHNGSIILLRRDGIVSENDNLTVEYEPDAGTAIIDRNIMEAPYHFFSFGRVRDDFSGEPVLRAISMLNAVKPRPKNKYHFSQKAIDTFKILIAESNKSLGIRLFDCVGEVKYDDSTAKVVECRKQDGGLMLLLWIDPSKGYICPFMQTYDDRTGNLRYEHKASQFFKEEKSGLWFPAYYEHTQNSAKTDFKTFQVRMIYKIDKDSFQLNVKISDEEFAVDIPEGQAVSDRRKGENHEMDIYKAKQQGTLSLSDSAMDLTKKDWLEDISSTVTFIEADGTRTPLKPPVKAPPKKDSLSSFIIRIVLTSVGAVMILAAVIIVIIKKFRTLPLILLSLLLFMGCNAQPDIPQGKVTLEPATDKIGFNRMTR
ncbi:hypothetical protein FACS1894189_8640 [Planctomycetales bacterium]|nr:hypothetical protein FACS1894189_8640 [Planctomycetales bacterium]